MHVVYWLFDDDCTDPKIHGYIGVTNNLLRRIKHHQSTRKTPFNYSVLFQSTEEECYLKEVELRPYPKIGWNVAAGGLGPVISNWKSKTPTEETRTKMRESRLKAIAEGQPHPMKGKKHSDESKAKMSESRLKGIAEGRITSPTKGKHSSEETKALIRAARALQAPTFLGHHHSEETKRKQSILAKKLNKKRHRDKLGRYTD